MASRLKEKNAHGTNINFFRTREQEFLVYFDKKTVMAISFTIKTCKES